MVRLPDTRLAAACAAMLLLVGCGNDTPTEPARGVIHVVVQDNSGDHVRVPDVRVTLLPDSVQAVTDASGSVWFDAVAGEHVVEASVCCIGPGFIEYHEPVTVAPGDTTDVVLWACLACVSR